MLLCFICQCWWSHWKYDSQLNTSLGITPLAHWWWAAVWQVTKPTIWSGETNGGERTKRGKLAYCLLLITWHEQHERNAITITIRPRPIYQCCWSPGWQQWHLQPPQLLDCLKRHIMDRVLRVLTHCWWSVFRASEAGCWAKLITAQLVAQHSNI